MANQPVFTDPETGLKRKREQRPDGEGTKYRIGAFGGWEVYYCLGDDCPYDTFWSEQFDMHYFHKHERPASEKRALEEAAERFQERAARVKPDRL